MLRKCIVLLACCLMSGMSSGVYADTIINGDLLLRDGGGLIFPDHTKQSTAQVQGPVGPQGPAGPAGGPPNTLTIGNVLTGNSGTAASAAITGTAPNQILNLLLPQGPQGPAPDLSNYYTKSQVDNLLASVTSLIALQPASGLIALANDTTITLSWNPVAQATSYNIYWATSPGITKSSNKVSSISSTSFQHTGLTRGNVYFYAIAAHYGTGDGPLSPEVFKQAPYVAPNPTREFEPNNTPATATQITIGGGQFRGQLSTRAISFTNMGDFDYYSFTSNGGVVQFSITFDTAKYQGGLIRANVLAQDGSTILAGIKIYDSSSDFTPTMLTINTLPGLYYLEFLTNTSYPPDTFISDSIFYKDYIVQSSYVF
jgi:hypothetical protein